MTGPHVQGRLDQVLFGWSQHQGRQCVLAHTFDDPDERVRWQHRLQSHIRLQRMPDTELPDAALSYFAFPEGKAVLLRRVNAGVSAGRNNSHALIGPAKLLTPRAALGLSFWKKWWSEPPVPSIVPLTAQLAVEASREADNRLFPVAAANSVALVPILAGLLTDPGTPVSVIGCPDELRLAMVWALIEVADRTGMGLVDRSFSTYEDRHDAGVERAPHIVFLPARPYEGAEVSRTIVDLGHPVTGGPPVETAQLLCQRLVNHSLSVVDRPARDDIVRPADSPQPRPVPVPAEEALVAQLRGAQTLYDFDRALADLQRRPPEQRRLVRSVLDVAALDAAALRVEVTFREELLRRLLEAVYGPEFEDLGDPQAQKHAVDLVRDGGSEQLAMMVGASEAAARGPIAGAAFKRWTAAAREARPEPAARLVRRMRATRLGHYLPLVTAAAVVAILAVAFLGGVLLGRSASDGRAVVASPPARSAPASVAPGLPSGRIVGGFATIHGINPVDTTVVAFVRAGGALLRVQGPCLTASGDIWFCPSRGDLPPAENAALVAYAMPKKRADSVLQVTAPQTPAADWGDPYEVH